LIALAGNHFAHIHQFAEIGGQLLGPPAHVRHHRAKQHRRPQRLQGIFGAYQQSRRRTTTGALQCCENFGNLAAARIE
jgi:hypothetical protein